MTTALPAAAIFLTLYIWAGGSPDLFLTGDSRWNLPARDFQIEQSSAALDTPAASPAERCQIAVNRYANRPISQRIDGRSLAIDEMEPQGRSPELGTRPPLLPATLAAVAVGTVFGFMRTRKTI
jgi:hypothetical protein